MLGFLARRVPTLLLAGGLSIAVAGSALAASWSPATPLTSSGNVWNGRIANLGTSSAIVVYQKGKKIQTRRTIDGGLTWRVPALVSKTGAAPDIAGSGSAVDIVWAQGRSIRYRRSINGGSTYRPAITLGSIRVCPKNTAGCSPAPGPQVAHGPNGIVAVTWLDDRTDGHNRIYVRVSTNSGATFGPARLVHDDTSGSLLISGPDVAVGSLGVIHVAFLQYESDYVDALDVTRSTDSGSSWSRPISLGTAMDTNYYEGPVCGPALTAIDTHAYVAYCDGYYDDVNGPQYGISYSRTIDSGQTWTDGQMVTPLAQYDSPAIELSGGVLRLIYGHYDSGGKVLYRQSTNGLTWSSQEAVAGGDSYTGGVTYVGGKVVVLFYDGNAKVTTRTP